MAISNMVLGVPASVLNLVQEGLLERAFHDGLVPAFLYRQEAQFEKWDGNTGTEMFMSRPGLLAPITTPLQAAQEPQPQALTFEQWVARLDRFAGRVDVHMPTAAVANSDLFLRSIHQLGIQAGQSLNRIPRNALFKPYLSGNTVLISAVAAGDLTIRIASLNGFTEAVIPGSTVRPASISPSNPLPITITVTGGSKLVRNAIGFAPDNPNDVYGPGTLTISAALGTTAPARAPVVSAYASTVIRTGTGDSVDAIGSGDTAVLQDFINATNLLRKNNIMRHPDGFYHAHIEPAVESQLFADPVFQRLHTALPKSEAYQDAAVYVIAGIKFFINNENPNSTNAGSLTATGSNAYYASDIGGEVINESALPIARTVVTGKGCLYELGLDESAYVSEAGVTGKIGEFDVVNAGVQITTERVRLVIAAPIDPLMDMVRCSWSITSAFPAPSDVTARSSTARYKRAVVIEHVGS